MGLLMGLLGGVEYAWARHTGMTPSAAVARHVIVRVKQGGLVAHKIAQLVAARNDVIDDPDVLREFRSLQSREREPGVYEASIATVRVNLADNTAVKQLRCRSILAQRRSLATWLWAMRLLAARDKRFLICVDALDTLLQEIDLRAEKAKNELFRSSFDSIDASGVVQIPKTLSADDTRVVMEYMPSVLANDLDAAIDLATVNSFFRDVVLAAITTGVVHADLHTGNIGYAPESGSIVIYDFGSIRQLDTRVISRVCRALVLACEHIFFEDWVALSRHLVANDIVSAVDDVENIRKVVAVAMQYSSGGATSLDIGRCMQEVKGDVALSESIFQLVQSISVLEGSCKVLNPEFCISDAFADARYVLRFVQLVA